MTTNQTNERALRAAEEIGRLVDDTCSTNEDFATIIAKHFPAESVNQRQPRGSASVASNCCGEPPRYCRSFGRWKIMCGRCGRNSPLGIYLPTVARAITVWNTLEEPWDEKPNDAEVRHARYDAREMRTGDYDAKGQP